MRTTCILLFVPALTMAAAASACSSGDVTLAPVRDAGAGDAPLDGTSAADGAEDAVSPVKDAQTADDSAAFEAGVVTGVAYLRFAHLSASVASVDICLSTAGSPSDFSKSKPLLGPRSPSGLSFAQVSAYQNVDAGSYGVRYVAPGAIDCSQPFPVAAPMLVLASEAFATVVIASAPGGAAAPVLLDDPPTTALVDGGIGSALRVANEVPGLAALGPIDVGMGSLRDGNYQSMFPQIAFGATSAQGGAIDPRGYFFPATISGTRLSAHVDGAAADDAIWESLDVGFEEIATLFLVSGTAVAADGGPGPRLRGVLCARDYAQPKAGALNPTCTLLP